MVTNIFVNLVTKDLNKAKEFYQALGFKINTQFTDETAASVVISENIFAMILTEEKFKSFTNKKIIDSKDSVEVLNALSVESKESVDDLYNKAIAAGGKKAEEDQDTEFMFSKAFEDLDGHIWEVIWMDPNYVQPY